MCEFCENIKTYYDFKTLNPYLIFIGETGWDKPAFHIHVPTDEGIDYSVDNVKFCPYCGKKLTEVSV